MGFYTKKLSATNLNLARSYCGVAQAKNTLKCKVLIVGGGTGGCSIAWRLSKKLNKNEILVLEPSPVHYNQPLFTLVAAGLKQFKHSCRPTRSVLPPNVAWLRDSAAEFHACDNKVYTECETVIHYDYMVVAIGLANDYDEIPGLFSGLKSGGPITTIYSPKYCVKTWDQIRNFKGGHAVFTYPSKAGKCPGAAQKIMYLSHDYWRKQKLLPRTNISYMTGGRSLFGIPKYAATLSKVVNNKNIAVNTEVNLVQITGNRAVFLDKAGGLLTVPYNFIHVTPPMRPPACLTSSNLVDDSGYLDVNPYTLQHNKFYNVYGIGDCLSAKNSKTAAAVSGQSFVVSSNLLSTIYGLVPSSKYDGYGACPMLTSYKTGILAEFLYDKKVAETFPFDQSKERRFFSYLNKYLFPYMYWNCLIKGRWNGPSSIRKYTNPFGT